MHWHALFGKFRTTIMIFFLIPVIIFDIVLSVTYAGKISGETKHNIENAYLQTAMQIEQQFKMINTSFNKISADNNVRKIMTSSISEMGGTEATIAGGGINKLINETLQTNPCVKAVEIYSSYNYYLISTVASGYIYDISPDWYEKFLKTDKSEFVYSDNEKIMLCKRISLDGDIFGIVIFEVGKPELLERLRIDEYKLDIGIILKNIAGEKILEYGNINNSGKTLRQYKLSSESIILDFIDGGGNIKSIYKTVALYSVICLVIGIVAVYILAFFCSMYLYDSLSNVLSSIDVFDDRKKGGSIKNMSSNVLENISTAENIEQKLAESLNALHQAQLTALQMQINPHFVFNVLNYANSVILEITKCDNDAVKIIVLLCEIFEFVMEEPKYMTTVAQEIEIAEKYIEIERLKTGLEFETVFEVDNELWDCTCPKMFMQPIIENSVMHGLKRAKERKGSITIKVKKIDNCIEFCVSDNGKGMTSDKLNQIKEQLQDSFADYSKHIGMRNVNQRIKLIYGKEYGLSVNSDENGTDVIMRIPIK